MDASKGGADRRDRLVDASKGGADGVDSLLLLLDTGINAVSVSD